MSLISQLIAYGRPYVLLVGDLQRALALHDQGIQVVVGPADDLESYQRVRAANAALVVATGDDAQNTAIAFTVREVAERVPPFPWRARPSQWTFWSWPGHRT